MPTEFPVSETVDASGRVRGQVCLALGRTSRPSIVYTTTSNEVKLAERDASGWTVSQLPGVYAERDEYRVSLSLDDRPEPQPHVAFISAGSGRVVYGTRQQQWQFEEVPNLTPGPVRFPSMMLYRGVLEDGNFPEYMYVPHFCFQAGLQLWHAAKLRLRVAARPVPDPAWNNNVAPIKNAGNEAGWFAALDFFTYSASDGSPRDKLRIAYFDDQSGRRQLRLATMTPPQGIFDRPDRFDDSGGWRREVLHGGDVLGGLPSLTHTVNGDGAVSYFETRARALNICIFGNFPQSPAVEKITDDLGGEVDVRSSIGASNQSRFCIAYGTGGRLKLATRTRPNTFKIEDVEAGGGWPSLEFDDGGNVHIAHVAGGTLKYTAGTPSRDE